MPVAIHLLLKCRCKTKRNGNPCGQPAMLNGCCRLHGGKSTGPKTSAGRQRIATANTKHGHYSQESLYAWREMKRLLKEHDKLSH